MNLETVREKIAKLSPENRWTIHLFESINTQRPPDVEDDYTPEKLEAAYREDMEKCLKLGLTKDDLRLLIDIDKLSSDRWDKEIVAKLLA